MALTATVYHLQIDLSDVDRAVYATLDLRVARHPSESMRYMMARTLAYCLQYEEGISFSKGLSTADEPPVWIHDLQGTRVAWIDVGSPSAERLHKARKSTGRVALYTYQDLSALKREASLGRIHKAETIDVFLFDPAFLDALEAVATRNAQWTLLHHDGQLYVTSDGKVIEGTVVRASLIDG
jgi:uncharacterized protein YaeQ